MVVHASNINTALGCQKLTLVFFSSFDYSDSFSC